MHRGLPLQATYPNHLPRRPKTTPPNNTSVSLGPHRLIAILSVVERAAELPPPLIRKRSIGHVRDGIMAKRFDTGRESGEPMVYQIRINGQLNAQWTDWFDGMRITPQENGDTLVTGPVLDQAALYGLLRKVRDLGMPLLSVTRVMSGSSDTSNDDTAPARKEDCF